MLIDRTVLATYGRHSVLAEAVTVAFRDHSTLQLHEVHMGDWPVRELRALAMGSHGWGLLDVRALARTLDADLRALHERDVAGMVALTLRASYPSAQACMLRAAANLMAAWQVFPHQREAGPVHVLRVRNQPPRAAAA